MVRFFRYQLIRLLRTPDDCARIAQGFGIGVFVGSTPFLGFHTILSLTLAKLFRRNLLAAFIGSFIFTFLLPIIFSTSYYFFSPILGYSVQDIDFHNITNIKNLYALQKGFLGIVLGSLIWGTLLGVSSSLGLYFILKEWRARRRKLIFRNRKEESKEDL